MLDRSKPSHVALYLLADHLDAALAAGEDLLATRLPPLAELDQIEDATERELARFVSRLVRLEASLVGRVLQARRRLAELPRVETDVRQLARLFVAGTACLEDMIPDLGNPMGTRFDSGLDRLPFLRDRGLLAADAACLALYDPLEVGNSYRLYGKIEVGPVLDLVSRLLDVLDDHHDLYAEQDVVSQTGFNEGELSLDGSAGAVEAPLPTRTDRADLGEPDSNEAVTGARTTADDQAAADHSDDVEIGSTLTPGSLAAALEALEHADEASVGAATEEQRPA